MDAVTLRQSKQLQRKVLTRPGATMGCHSVSYRIQCSDVNDIDGDTRTTTTCTAPQKQVAVASVSVDQPSRATPERGRLLDSALLLMVIDDIFVLERELQNILLVVDSWFCCGLMSFACCAVML